MALKIEENVVKNPPIRIKFQRTSGNDFINLENIRNCRVTLNKLALFSNRNTLKSISETGEKNLKKVSSKSKKIKKIKIKALKTRITMKNDKKMSEC